MQMPLAIAGTGPPRPVAPSTDHMLLAAVVAAVAMFAWLWLLIEPAALDVCGGTGRGFASLMLPWLAMNVATTLPAGIHPILATGRHTAPLPLAFVAAFSGTIVVVGVAAACAQQALQGLGFFDLSVSGRLFPAAALGLLGLSYLLGLTVSAKGRQKPATRGGFDRRAPAARCGLSLGCASLRCCLVMLSLQIYAGTIGPIVMAGLMLWMALESVLPWKRTLSALSGIALVTAGGLSLANSIL